MTAEEVTDFMTIDFILHVKVRQNVLHKYSNGSVDIVHHFPFLQTTTFGHFFGNSI